MFFLSFSGGCCCDCGQDLNSGSEKVRLQVVMKSSSVLGSLSSSLQTRVVVAADRDSNDEPSCDGQVVPKNKNVIHGSSDGLLLDGADHENVTLL